MQKIAKIAYFDAGSGIAGDMVVGALLDAGCARGLSVEGLSEALQVLAVGGYRLQCDRVEVAGIEARSFRVLIEAEQHEHRSWRTIRRLIEEGGKRGLADGVVERSLRIFELLARAEAKVHRVDVEAVHFHEVGAIDSIVDIVATAWCLDVLAVESCFVGPLPSGSGYVDSEHGRLPLPAPATVELLRGFEVLAGDGSGELVTPTGAAILAALARSFRPLFRLEATGSGAGERRLEDRPNLLRVFLGEAEIGSGEYIVAIEADIDDMTPAALAYVAECLRARGARDVSLLPLQMKKGRLGLRLTVLCDLDRVDLLANHLLAESSTIGLRYRAMVRDVLPRRMEQVETGYGPVALKVVERPGRGETAEPEFNDVAAAARKSGVSFATVRKAAIKAWSKRS